MNEAIDLRISCQHELLLHLTRPRDLCGLHQALAEAIEGLCPRLTPRLYEYNRAQHAWQPAMGMPDYGDGDMKLLRGMRNGRSRIVPAAERPLFRSIYLVQSEHDLLGALVLEGDPDNIAEERLRVFLSLYANQYYILSRSKRDGLTDLLNRQAFDERLQRIYQQNRLQLRRVGEACVHGWQLAMLDIDHFKRVNDSYGHLCGDEVLLRFTQVMHQSFRDYDYLFRYGGEEFTVLLKNVDNPTAHGVLERFRQKVAETAFPRVGRVTVSIGHTPLNLALPPTANIGRADQALYAAKGAGRNRVVCFEAAPLPG